MIKVKVLLIKGPYILFIFQLDSMWYGLYIYKETVRRKRIRSIWSVKRILEREKVLTGTKNENLDIVLTEAIKRNSIWQTEVELKVLDLFQFVPRYIKQKLIHESTRESME